jgi:hypothetical protein
MKHRHTKKLKKFKVKTVRSKIIHVKKNKITYTIEPIEAKTRDPTVSGDIYKKFKNGKLVKQVFVSKNKFKEIIDKLKKKYVSKHLGGRLGEIRPAEKVEKAPEVVIVKDETSFWQTLKQGFGFGLAFTAGQEIMQEFFSIIFDN